MLREGELEQQEQEKTAGAGELEPNSMEGREEPAGESENSKELGAKQNRAAEIQARLSEIARVGDEIEEELDKISPELHERRVEIASKMRQSIEELGEIDEDDDNDKNDDDDDNDKNDASSELPQHEKPVVQSIDSPSPSHKASDLSPSADGLRQRRAL